MTDNAIPSIDPADTGSMSGLLRQTFKKLMQSTDGMLPATVIAVSADRNFVTVQPVIMVLATDGSTTQRAQIASVPAMAMGAGGFVFSFPIKAGDLGWIFASDRDISLYIQSNKQAAPNTNRLHSFEDGMFIPDKARQWALADEDADNSVWQSLDGTEKISLGAAKIKFMHPTLVEFDAPHVTIPNGDLKVSGGFGFFGAAPPGAQPHITGALSGVGDANAKAVLTSIIAVMVGNGGSIGPHDMTSIATNAKNDIYRGPDGNLVMASGVTGVSQDCEHAMKAQLGEMVLNLQRGVPTMETIWNNWNPVQFEAYARRMLLSVPFVKAVTSFNITRSGDVATYVATIQVDTANLPTSVPFSIPIKTQIMVTEGGFVITTETGQPIGLQ